IQVADFADSSPQIAERVSRFSRTALYLLVAPSTPESARQEAVTRVIEGGETITPQKAKEIVKRHKPVAPPRPSRPAPRTTTPALKPRTETEVESPVEVV